MSDKTINVSANYVISNLDYSKTNVRDLYDIEIYRYINAKNNVLARVDIIETDKLLKRHPTAKHDMVTEILNVPWRGDTGNHPSELTCELNGITITLTLSTPYDNTHIVELDKHPIDVSFRAVTSPVKS